MVEYRCSACGMFFSQKGHYVGILIESFHVTKKKQNIPNIPIME